MSELPRHLNGKTLAGRYDRLGPEERFRLALEAGARDDERERERLVASAPMRAAKVTDPAYMDRIEASRELALAVALDLGSRIVALRLLTAIPRVFAGALAVSGTVWAEADDAEEAAVKETVHEMPAMQACRKQAARSSSEAAAVLAAFGEVCRSCMKLEPDVVLAAHLGPEMVATLGLDELDGVTPDKAALKGWRELLERTWQRRTGG